MSGIVRAISGTSAIMEDGRKVRLGPIQDVKIGDCLEMYADIALSKVDTDTVTEDPTVRRDI